jgi:hypothetical protein
MDAAFTPAENNALDTWIPAGGRLWLVADHDNFVLDLGDLGAQCIRHEHEVVDMR